MIPKQVLAIIIAVVVLVGGGFVACATVGHNDYENWQVIQDPDGDIEVRDTAGFYFRGAATVTTYPRVFTLQWGPSSVTFNDGGIGTMVGTLKVRVPVEQDKRLLMHREFSADETMRNAEISIESHLANVLQTTGPVMSGSEHQAARKGEFYNLVFAQIEAGIYQSERIRVELEDQLDQEGKPLKVFATSVITDAAGNPVIKEKSPLIQWGFEIAQFSIENVEYDQKTLELFASKKESLLNAERSKAAREEQIQERLMIEQRGLKEKAEVAAKANMEKERLTIEAETQVSIARQDALRAEQEKQKALTEAGARKEVAQMNLEAERLNSEAMKIAAAAQEEKIQKAGAITEKDRILAEIERDGRIGVARELSRIAVPSFMITGGSEGGSSLDQLLNVFMMRQMGVFDPSALPK